MIQQLIDLIQRGRYVKCFLHIGTEKTASTSIQSFFSQNRKKLLEAGFLYSASAGNNNHRHLVAAAYKHSRRDFYTRHHSLTSDSILASHQQKIIENIKDEIIETKKSRTDLKLIFSSEHIQSKLELSELYKLKSILESFGINDINVIAYLRKPADIVNSRFSTAIKAGRKGLSPPKPGNHVWSHICNHQRTIETFEQVFGEKKVTPRLFDKQILLKGSPIVDIANVIGVSNLDDYCLPSTENESLSIEGIYLLSQINQIIPENNQLKKRLISQISENYSSPKYAMPRNLYESYTQSSEDSNEWVRTRYFPHLNRLFSDTIPDETHLEKERQKDLDKVITLLNTCIKHRI